VSPIGVVMQIQIATLCDAATDYNGKLCILGTVDTLGAVNFPVTHPSCAVALRFCFSAEDEGEHTVSIGFVDADGQPMGGKAERQFGVKVPTETSFICSNMVVNIQGLQFQKPGEYLIRVMVNGDLYEEIPLRVIQVQQPAGQAPAQ